MERITRALARSRDQKNWRTNASLLALGVAIAASSAWAADAQTTQASQTTTTKPPSSAKHETDVSEVVVHGVPYKETVLPTRLQNISTYGLNLSVIDTPRNTTLLSTTQLETVNIDDPRAFSYLTSSSYSDASFGTPNIPRVRTEYADIFYNGMRDSLSQNGYGVPINFDSFANISITKGPANVIDGPGANQGGEVDFLTKQPNMDHSTALIDATMDSVVNRRLTLDYSTPLIKDDLAVLLSYSGENSGSDFYGHWMHKNALYAAVRWEPTDNYSLDFNTEINVEQYTEDVGVNRANQQLINNGSYLTGGNPPADNYGFETFWDATGTTQLNPRITIDETPDTYTRALLYNAQLIQKFKLTPNLTLENNTFFMFQDSDNHENYYYSDESDGSYTIENKTTLNGNFTISLGGEHFDNQFVVGGTFRFAHTNYISDFNNEAVSVWDLSTNPNTWVLDPSQQAYGDASPYKSVFGAILYGVPGRDSISQGNTGVSDLYDTGLFFQDRLLLTDALSVLFGARIDALQDHSHDPLGCAPNGAGDYTCLADTTDVAGVDLPADHTTGVFGLGSFNLSVLYKLTPAISAYVTFDWTQSPPNPDGGEGGINAYGIVPDSKLLRGDSFLYETGMKFDLLDKRLFVGAAVFNQKHQVPTGPDDALSEGANTTGGEIEANYQPNRNLFATASYSYITTVLASPPDFYDFPAQPGVNVDGAGTFVSFLPGQKVDQPDQPKQLFNFLVNYKFQNGLGFRTAVQVTSPISLTASSYINVSGLFANGIPLPTASLTPTGNPDVYYYHSPVIPWQYTWNLAAFYEWNQYRITFSVYNVTDQMNWQPSPTYYGNDFLVRSDPRTYEVRLTMKF